MNRLAEISEWSSTAWTRRTPRGRETWLVALCVGVAVLATLAVYRPDRLLPFDFVDFSEFLPLLKRGESFFGRMRELLAYYTADQGRISLVGFASFALKWELWEDFSPGWQWSRFITMWMVIVLTYHLLRRTGATRLACLAGASLFLFSPPALDGWIRLTMGEPLGAVLLLSACFVALRAQSGSGEWRIGLAFAVWCVLLVQLKEMLAATLLLPIVLVAAGVGRTQIPRLGVRLRTLVVAAAAGTTVAGIPVLLVALRAPADAYTAEFGAKFRPPADALAHWSLGIAPFDPGSSFPPALVGAALLAFAAILVAGWRVRLRRDRAEWSLERRLLAIGLAFPLVGTLVYLPWPSYNRFYAIPYLLGGGLLAALALSALEQASRRAAIAGYASWLVFLVFAGSDAASQSGRMSARQKLNRSVVARLAELRGTDTVFLATEQRAPTFWQGIGPTLQRYGQALGYSMPPIVNATCDESRRLVSARETPVLIYASLCPRMPAGEAMVVRYQRLRLPSLRPVTDSIRVDLVLPAAESPARHAAR